MVDFEGLDAIEDWGKWKNNLSKAIKLGQFVGMSEKTIDNIGYKIGNMLTATVDPENKEERLLKELWIVGDDSERKNLAKLIVKMIERKN